MRDGLIDVLEALENDKGEDLQTQLKIFQEHKEEDFDEFAQRYILKSRTLKNKVFPPIFNVTFLDLITSASSWMTSTSVLSW